MTPPHKADTSARRPRGRPLRGTRASRMNRAPLTQQEADGLYWRDVVRFRWAITIAYFALTAAGVLPAEMPWFLLAAGVLFFNTLTYTIYRRRTMAYTRYQDIASCLDIVTISLVLISTGAIGHPIWVSYVLVIPAVANFKGHRYNALFALFVLASYAAAYAGSELRGGRGHAPDEAIVTGVLILFIALNSSIISANNRRLRDVVQTLADTDPLTGLLNRRVLFERLDQWEQRGQPLAAMMIDLDDFKLLNESIGHITADRLLVRIAEMLRDVPASGSLAARFGGDEFALLVEIPDREDAQRLGERLILEARERAGVGITIGIALCPGDAATPERALQLADGNLGRAKAAGKERAYQRAA